MREPDDRGIPSPYLAAIFLAALLLRLAYLFTMADGPYFASPQLDELFYDLHARRIASGKGLGDGPLFRAPLYTLFLGAIYTVIGQDFFIPRLLQAVGGSFTALLCSLIACRVFDRRTGLVAGSLAAVWPTLIFFDGELLITSLFTLLVTLSVWLHLRAPGNADSPVPWALAGLTGGLGAVTRPNLLLVFPLLFGWTAWQIFRSREETGDTTPPRKILIFALYGLALILPILPVTAYNMIHGKDRVLIATQGGINFWLGNREVATGHSVATPIRFDYAEEYIDSVALYGQRQAELDLGRELKPFEADAYWYGRTREVIRESPARWFRLLLRKTHFFWFAGEIKNNKEIAYAMGFSPMGFMVRVLPFGLLVPFVFAGFLRPVDPRERTLLLGVLLLFMLSVVLFFVCSRFRMPVVPLILVFAAAGAVWLFDVLRRGRAAISPRVIGALGLALFGGAVSWSDPGNLREGQKTTRGHEIWVAANGYTATGRFDAAIDLYRQALEYEPDNGEYRLNYGRALYAADRKAEAREVFESLLRSEPDNAPALNNLGLILMESGEDERAEALWRRAIEIEPTQVTARLNLADALIVRGDREGAIALVREVLALDPANAQAKERLGLQ